MFMSGSLYPKLRHAVTLRKELLMLENNLHQNVPHTHQGLDTYRSERSGSVPSVCSPSVIVPFTERFNPEDKQAIAKLTAELYALRNEPDKKKVLWSGDTVAQRIAYLESALPTEAKPVDALTTGFAYKSPEHKSAEHSGLSTYRT